jgi:capsular polysaccharide biosynthesis protein
MRIVARNWYLLVIGGVLGAALVLWATTAQTEEYRATTRLAVGPATDLLEPKEVTDVVNALNKRAIVTTFAEIVRSDRVLARAGDRAGLGSPDDQGYEVLAVAEPEANVIGLEVDGPDPSIVAALAAAVADEAAREIEQYYWTYSVWTLVDPRVPHDPVRPRPERDVPVGAGVGVGVGLLAGVVRSRLR